MSILSQSRVYSTADLTVSIEEKVTAVKWGERCKKDEFLKWLRSAIQQVFHRNSSR